MAGFKCLNSSEIMSTHRSPTIVHFEIDYQETRTALTIPVKAGTFVLHWLVRDHGL